MGQGALAIDQLVFVPQVVEWGTLASYMLGSSGHNKENLIENQSGALCWEKCHGPRTLKNAAVVFDRNERLD